MLLWLEHSVIPILNLLVSKLYAGVEKLLDGLMRRFFFKTLNWGNVNVW